MNSQTIEKNYQIISVIGKGSFAKVLLAKNKINDNFYALKCMKKKQFRHKNKQNRLFQQKSILQQMNNPFIVQLFATYQTDQLLYFVISYCSGGDLHSQLRLKKRFSEDQILFYSAQIILAIQYLHQKNIIYRDLKPQNVLINKDGYIKLTDFGLSKSRIMSDQFKTYSVCGTPQYLSPQILTEQGHGKAFDWWCLGMIIYEFSHGRPAFLDKNQNTLFKKIIETEPNYDSQISKDLEQVIKKLLIKDPNQRLHQAKKLKDLNFYKNMNFQQLAQKKVKPCFIPELQKEEDLKYFYKPFTELDLNCKDSADKTKYKNIPEFDYVCSQFSKKNNFNYQVILPQVKKQNSSAEKSQN